MLPKAAGRDAGAEQFLTVGEVARRLRVSTATVYKLCARGGLTHVRVLNVVRIPATALQVMVTRGTRDVEVELHACYPASTSATGFGARAVLSLTGISYRQLDHWARTGLVGSSVRQATGRGSRRVYSFPDLVALRVVRQLREAGMSVQTIRRAVKWLRSHADQPLATLALAAQGKKVFALTEDPAKLIEATGEGQVVLAISVAKVARHLERGVSEISAPREATIRVRGRGYKALLTPDLEAGGYTVEVPELPGCVTEGGDLAEAKRMAKDAIELWLSVAEPQESTAKSRAR